MRIRLSHSVVAVVTLSLVILTTGFEQVLLINRELMKNA